MREKKKKKTMEKGRYFFAALFLGLVGGVAKAGPIKGYVDCLNDEDCLGANKLCFRNTTMRVGKCICKEGYKPAKEDPIKCLNIAERECHSNLDCAGHYPCISHFPILHAMNRVMDDQFFVGMKKECFAAFDPTVGGFRRSDELFQQPYYLDPNRHLHSPKYAKFHPTYIKFVEDAMLVLFLLCVLITLLVVHRGSCYRQIRQARRNGPLRYIIPHPDDLPPPYSNYGPATTGTTNDGQSRANQGNGNVATDDVDGNNMVDLEDKNRSETPPPSYDEALAINIQAPENPLHPPDGATSNDNLFVALPPNTPPPPLSPIEGATSLMTTTNSRRSAIQVTTMSSATHQPPLSIRTNV